MPTLIAEFITSTKVDEHGIVCIYLNNPAKLNCLSAVLIEELSKALDYHLQSDKTKGIILSGQGKAFCAGADIQELAQTDSVSGEKFAQHGQNLMQKIINSSKIIIAAVNGMALGGGCELACAAHIRIASKTAIFGQPEVKLGVIPGFCGTQRLSKLIGLGRALDLCITGKNLSAVEAMQWGLVSDVYEDNLIDNSKKILRKILTISPYALKKLITVMQTGYDMSLEAGLKLEANAFAALCGSKDKAEGISAFLNKRSAAFSGE